MKIKKVYLGRRQIYPDWWSPGENTIAYYPFKEDFDDASGNSTVKNLTNTWTPQLTTESWVLCAYYPTSAYSTRSWTVWATATSRTINAWIKNASQTLDSYTIWVWHNDSYGKWSLQILTKNNTIQYNDWYWSTSTFANVSTWWYNMIITQSWNTVKIYVNGTLQLTTTWQSTWLWATDPQMIRIAAKASWIYSGAPEDSNYTWYFSEVIIENKTRTEQEVSNYFNGTKSNYWIQ